MEREIPDERTRGKDDPVVPDKTLGTPFSKLAPILRWHGKSQCVLQLPAAEGSVWITFSYAKPTDFSKLVPQKETKSERIFFNIKTQKFLRVANETLTWSYYATGPFQRLENGAWIDVDLSKEIKEEEWELIGTEENPEKLKVYWLNPFTGIVKITPLVEEEAAKAENKDEEEKEDQKDGKNEQTQANSYDDVRKEIKEKRTEMKLDDQGKMDKAKAKNEEVWKAGSSLLDKINDLQDIKNWKEAIIKGEGSAIPMIKTNKIMEAFEEVCEAYGIGYELARHQEGRTDIRFPIDNQNDVKFLLGVILPELYLYPQSFLKQFSIRNIHVCGAIERKGQYRTWTSDRAYAYLNSKERNIMRIQQGFHQVVGHEILKLFNDSVPSFAKNWKALNPPDFFYDPNRKKAPKGIKGFLTFESLVSYNDDVLDIYFALIKDPKTVLEHNDIIIAKKAHLLKIALEELCPEGINDQWWGRVQNYKDIIELALGNTETFKEAKLENLNGKQETEEDKEEEEQ